MDESGHATPPASFGPANLKLLSDRQLLEHLRSIAVAFPQPTAVGIGMAGARTLSDQSRLRKVAQTIWPHAACVATHDLDTALAAADADPALPRVLVLSGTGSCCYGRGPADRTERVGGWGHLLGDQGSGYDIGLQALRRVVETWDLTQRWGTLGRFILEHLHLNEPDQLVGWIHATMGKGPIAALTPVVFRAATRRDPLARAIIDLTVLSLANAALACAHRLAPPGSPMQFVAAGGVLVEQPGFARRVQREILKHWPAATVTRLRSSGSLGAARLAFEAWRTGHPSAAKTPCETADVPPGGLPGSWPWSMTPASRGLPKNRPGHNPPKPAERILPLLPGEGRGEGRSRSSSLPGSWPVSGPVLNRALPKHLRSAPPNSPAPPVSTADTSVLPTSTRLSPTEERHPRSMRLDRLGSGAAIDLLLDEDARIPDAIRRMKPQLQRALRLIHQALSTGGRLLYVGAGTSGRLGVLDASECPPTFRTPPEWVQGIIAGGAEAVFRAVEGAEDDVAAGRRSLEFREVTSRDVIVGIAASGRTPFVWGALAEARGRGARTVLICFNPHLKFAPGHRPDVVIAPRIGPELLTGSTRLKAGTATKLILNLLTTLTMVRLGKVVSNLMVDLNPANAKLRDRAVRITQELTGADEATTRVQLLRSGWIVKNAVKVLNQRRRPQRQT